MRPAVFGSNEQDDAPVDVAKYVTLANDVLLAERVEEEVEVNLLFVDQDQIERLNNEFMDRRGPTDVLSFPIDDIGKDPGRSPESGGKGPGGDHDGEQEPVMLGDVVICPKVAMANAPKHAGTYENELALLVVHGILHLLGMDHMDPTEAAEMEERERELLEAFWGKLPSTAWPPCSHDTSLDLDNIAAALEAEGDK